jgi:hypothetical protein
LRRWQGFRRVLDGDSRLQHLEPILPRIRPISALLICTQTLGCRRTRCQSLSPNTILVGVIFGAARLGLHSFWLCRARKIGAKASTSINPHSPHPNKGSKYARDRPHPGRPVRQPDRCQVLGGESLGCGAPGANGNCRVCRLFVRAVRCPTSRPCSSPTLPP